MDRYDLIVVGSGPGGVPLAHSLAPTGRRILLIERGDYLPRSRANWDSRTVFVEGTYQANETWYVRDGRSLHPGLHYFVRGNSKVYGAALLRLRGARLRRRSSTRAASPRLGRSPMRPSSPSTPRPRRCSTSTAGAARTPTSRPRMARSRTLQSRTSPTSPTFRSGWAP